MLELPYDYEACVTASEKASWTLDEVMPEGTKLDFARPFLPEALVGAQSLDCLTADEGRTLNQITGNSYLNLFAFVEEYILVTMSRHLQAELFGDHDAIRALSRFVDEEVKHQRLFQRYRRAFDRDFGIPCPVLESAAEVAEIILSKSPIAVLLLTLHIELMTQDHYTQAVKQDASIDPFFESLLRHHWMEESQHARIDALELQKLLNVSSHDRHVEGVRDYLDLCGAMDGLLRQQAELDASVLPRAIGRTLSEDELARLQDAQHQGYRRTFLLYGMRARGLRDAIGKMGVELLAGVDARALELEAT